MIKAKYILVIVLISILFACKKDEPAIEYTHLMFPIGRAHLGGHQVFLKINGQTVIPNIVEDGFGGYWIKIATDGLLKPSEIEVSYLRKKLEPVFFAESQTNTDKYLQAVKFIDSDNETLISKATELCTGLTTNIEKAYKIGRFVSDYLAFSSYKNSFLENASQTYNLRYGTCMNHSRLTVALCRAAGVPARSVWGVISDFRQNGIYDYHHQWTEILDNDGLWHPLDNTHDYLFNLNDINYLDLYYAPEQNSFIRDNPAYHFFLGDVKYFDGYPATLSGRLNCFTIVEYNSPDSIMLGYKYIW